MLRYDSTSSRCNLFHSHEVSGALVYWECPYQLQRIFGEDPQYSVRRAVHQTPAFAYQMGGPSASPPRNSRWDAGISDGGDVSIAGQVGKPWISLSFSPRNWSPIEPYTRQLTMP